MKLKNIIPFRIHDKIYKPTEIIRVLKKSVNNDMLIGNNKGIYTYNVASSFDIETSSFYIDNINTTLTYKQYMSLDSKTKAMFHKSATMYVWQLGINGYTIMGRTWTEFLNVCNEISDYLHLSKKRRLIIYVHNLSYEYGFMSHLFKWEKVFSIEKRKPIYAITNKFIEFRCSYLLSGYSLKNLAKQCIKYPCKKMVGDLDYNLIRHSKTPLTEKEVGYSKGDTDVVMCYIQEKIENDGNITKLPLTKTGYVRKFCRKRCLYVKGTNLRDEKYKKLMSKLQLELPEYKMLKRAFAGGFTHANALEVGDVHKDIASFDFTSSYPAVMICEKFPMSKGVKYSGIQTVEQLEEMCKKGYLAVVDIIFDGLLQKHDVVENPLSSSHCSYKKDVTENNGRVVRAEKVVTTITNIDLDIMKDFYTWENAEIACCYLYKAGYLPTSLIECVVELYEKKTTLKGVKGKEIEYQASKEMVNSCYGMCVTDPLQDYITFVNLEWGIESGDEKEKLQEYNDSLNRFLFYLWGVFITAHSRYNLFTAIKEVGDDFIYADTDSVKIKNKVKYEEYFNKYNKEIALKLFFSCKHHNIPYEKIQPKTIEGVVKMIGVWDYEGTYEKFKTLGAKRYMTYENGELSLTVAGVNKRTAIPYLKEKYDNDIDKIFDAFTWDLTIPPEKSGKNTHTYIDTYQEGIVTDYLGVKNNYMELTSVHMEPTGYNLSIAEIYKKYLMGIKTEVI